MRMTAMVVAAVVAVAMLAGGAAGAVERKGLDAPDGNTVVVEGADGRPQRLRLAGVDAPLVCQPWGTEARDALREWVKGQILDVSGPPGSARVVYEGRELSRRMVEDGHAWSTRSKWDRGPFVKEERVAVALKRGMHQQGGNLKPAEWRRTKGACPAA